MPSSWHAKSGLEQDAELPVQPSATIAFRIVRFIATPLLRLLFRIHVTGLANIPPGPYVLIANHLGWLDSFLILILFPSEPRIHFLADAKLLRKRRLQWWIVRRVAGYIPVDRPAGAGEMILERVAECLRTGAVLAVYPEGSYGPEEGVVQPLKRGFAHFALRAGVPVLPVGLSGTREPWVRKRVRLAVGKPLRPDGMASLMEQSQRALGELVPAYTEDGGPHLLKRYLTHLF